MRMRRRTRFPRASGPVSHNHASMVLMQLADKVKVRAEGTVTPEKSRLRA